MDRHNLALGSRLGAALLGLYLLFRSSGMSGPAGNYSFYLTASLLMCIGLVLLADRLIDEPGLANLAQACGYAGLAGIAIALLA